MDHGLKIVYPPGNQAIANEIADAIEGNYPELRATLLLLESTTAQPDDASAVVLGFFLLKNEKKIILNDNLTTLFVVLI
jgi:hypothetical protein